MPRIFSGTLETFVEKQVRALVETPLVQEALDEAAREALGQEEVRLLNEQERLEGLMGQKQRQLKRLLELITNGIIDQDTFTEQNTVLKEEKQNAARALAQVEAALHNRTAQEENQRLRQALMSFEGTWPCLDASERRAVLQLLVDKLEAVE